MKKPYVIVLTGASSVGKKPIVKALLEDKELDLNYCKSLTTRPKREDEIDGQDYFFISHDSFVKEVKEKKILEYTEFNGYYYGTSREQIEFLLSIGKNVLIDVEAQGVGQIKLILPEALCVFVEPSSMEDLEQQIRDRYNDNEFSMKHRINKAKMEMELLPLFRHTVKVDNVNEAVEDIKRFVVE